MLLKMDKCKMLRLFLGIMAIFVATLSLGCSTGVDKESVGQKKFSSPQEAVDALAAAVQKDNVAELIAILGPGSEDLISSGDAVADRNGRARFLKAYGEKNSLLQEQEGKEILLIGENEYPFPIPLVRLGDAWQFDTLAGKEEILNRRIGRNELNTIEVMHAFTDAEREYACMKREGEATAEGFAQKLSSSAGKKDGLYWKTGENEEESPFGPLIAKAAEEGYEGRLDQIPPEAFHGYYFKILKGQGTHATGGAFDYVVDNKMILGFALLAFPAKYGASGIMSFIVNQEGVIYEKDLGQDTAKLAEAMTLFDPDGTWHKYEEPVAN